MVVNKAKGDFTESPVFQMIYIVYGLISVLVVPKGTLEVKFY